jgi:hypothetical protein
MSGSGLGFQLRVTCPSPAVALNPVGTEGTFDWARESWIRILAKNPARNITKISSFRPK